MKIALCGNIASGKSTVQNILENSGFKVLDTDEVSHKLLTVKNDSLYKAFKDTDVFQNGEFSRQKVANLIFTDKKQKDLLEAILHPQIENEINEFFKKNSCEKLIFVGIPLLFEANMEYLFDKIIFIYADDDIRLERLINRNGYAKEYAKLRISCQIPQDEKVKKSDYVIYNNGTTDDLKSQITQLVKSLQE